MCARVGSVFGLKRSLFAPPRSLSEYFKKKIQTPTTINMYHSFPDQPSGEEEVDYIDYGWQEGEEKEAERVSNKIRKNEYWKKELQAATDVFMNKEHSQVFDDKDLVDEIIFEYRERGRKAERDLDYAEMARDQHLAIVERNARKWKINEEHAEYMKKLRTHKNRVDGIKYYHECDEEETEEEDIEGCEDE